MEGKVGRADTGFGGGIPDMVGGASNAMTQVVEEGSRSWAMASEGCAVEDESRRADNTPLSGVVKDSWGITGNAVAEVVDVRCAWRANASEGG